MTEDQWIELVTNAVHDHLSLDQDFKADWDYEIKNFANGLAKRLRIEGFPVPYEKDMLKRASGHGDGQD